MQKTYYSPATINALESLPDVEFHFDILEESNEAIVLDIYGVGERDLSTWIATVKSTVAPGSLYAYDHRLDGAIAPGAPEISILFENIHGKKGLVNLLSSAEQGSGVVSRAIASRQAQLIAAEDEKVSGLHTKSSDLLKFAAAF